MSFAQLKLKSCFLISKAIILRGFNDASLISRMYNPKVELMEPEQDDFQVPTFHGLIWTHLQIPTKRRWGGKVEVPAFCFTRPFHHVLFNFH